MEYVDLSSILGQFLHSFINFLPRLGGAIILLIIGWVVGSLVGRGIKRILVRYRIDQRIARGKKLFLRLSEVIPLIISWLIYLIFIQAALSEEVLGIPTLAEMVGAIILFKLYANSNWKFLCIFMEIFLKKSKKLEENK